MYFNIHSHILKTQNLNFEPKNQNMISLKQLMYTPTNVYLILIKFVFIENKTIYFPWVNNSCNFFLILSLRKELMFQDPCF